MHPILLVGAALVGLPILLHLIMKQEPKRLPFPAFRFLRQRLKTNQRKLRLRHFLLLALRMLLIALFALTLYQPTVLSTGLITLTGEQPLAVVLVIDTSPSMGYADGRESHLEEAARRALELVNDLPDGSRVAVVETGDPTGDWLPSVSDARGRLEDLLKRAQAGAVGGTQPVTAGLAAAYQLLKTVDAESDGAEPLPRLVAVFTDRAASSWDPARVEDLKKLRDAVPEPKVAHAVIDVGTDRPVNVALTAAEMTAGRSQVVPANQPAGVTVTVAAAGLDAPATVRAYLDDAREPLTKEVAVPDGQSRAVGFEFRDLKPGLHQVRFELETKDALPADNVRFFTFRTAEPRRVLTIADDPDAAAFWKLALDAKGEFAAEVVTPGAVKTANGRPAVTVPDPADPAKTRTDDLQAFEAVVLFEVARPAPLWDALRQYVEAGGKLVVVPGPPGRTALDEYNGEAAVALMPGALKGVVNTAEAFPRPKDPKAKDRSAGVVWSVLAEDDDRALQHPMLAPVRDAKRAGNIDFVKSPRRVSRYWEVEPRADGQVVVAYDDADQPAKRRPAVLERSVLDAKDKTPRGQVILLTTRLHVPSAADPEWNDYWDTLNSWSVVFPELLLRYAAGSTADANFNYTTGQTVVVPLAKLLAGKRDNLVLEGPGVALDEARITPAERQAELRLGPPRTNTPGNFTLTGPAPDWREGFGLNPPADESNLAKVPAAGVEDLTGPGTVVPVGKDVKLADVLTGTDQFKTPVDLFPWLLIGVLMLLVFEALLANRFYRRPK
ncbi:MAG: BatA domain-containing protein [Gemmataceae bacterium]|nr:BatA domain-containing protein [Gemmataceae bacterium]